MQRSKKQDLKRPGVGIKHEFIAAGHNIQFTSDSIIWVETCLRSTEPRHSLHPDKNLYLQGDNS